MPIAPGAMVFTAWAAAVAIWDCRTRRVPNALTVAGLAVASACSLLRISPFGIAAAQAAQGAALGFVAVLPFFLMRVMGAADVKVFAVLGAWCGVSALIDLWCMASIAAALHAVALLVAARMPVSALWRRGQPTFTVGTRRGAPYAALLVAAAALMMIGHRFPGGHA
ncbi:prepilin peptidase [Trinickia sp. EG282A]|uniref:prepilin peptidase n=1 Tax=Trinickia sp. EG282A TaxID=3237013 RepID=UPI0034D373AC